MIDGKVVIEQGAEIRGSTIRGPVAIGADTVVVDSFVGPYSAIGANCHVEGSEIEHLSRDERLDRDRHRPSRGQSDRPRGRRLVLTTSTAGLRLMVGDHCQVDVE
ncbi:MAG: hypothetical protein WKF45_02045 [Ilumatobacteraceae bacterium]